MSKINKVFKEKETKSYSYRAFLHKKEVYVQFNTDMAYPVPMLSTIIKSCKKKEFKKGVEMYGIILEVPNLFRKNLTKSTTSSASFKKRASRHLKKQKRAKSKVKSKKNAKAKTKKKR